MKPSDGRVSLKQLISFMEECASKLEQEGKEDSAFYFEQIAEFLTKYPHKALDESAAKVLGL